jgi:hypothetical protein
LYNYSRRFHNLWNPYINYHVDKSTPQFPALNQINPFHATPHYFLRYSLISVCAWFFQVDSSPQVFWSEFYIFFSPILCMLHTHHFISVFTLKTFGEEYRLWSYSFNFYNLPLLPHVQIFSAPCPQTTALLCKWQAKLHAHTKQQEIYNMGLNY